MFTKSTPTAVAFLTLALSHAAVSLSAQTTLAHWNFDAGSADASFSSLPAPSLSGSGPSMFGYDDLVGPYYSSETMTGSGLSAHVNGGQDGYIQDLNFNNWSPSKWTIEISVRLNKLDGWTTIIGRDGSSWSGNPKADFYFQKNGLDNHFRLDFATLDGSRYMIESPFAATRGVWYNFALVSDGSSVSMYADQLQGAGYELVASTALSRKAGANNALATSGATWTFGRGWYNGKQIDHIDGNFDDVRFTEGALQPSQFLHAVAAPISQPKLEAARTGQDISLTWTSLGTEVQSYSLYRNDREDPKGRARIATLYPPAKVYLDQVPEAEKIYWYWLVSTEKDGRMNTIGPVSSAPAEVWNP